VNGVALHPTTNVLASCSNDSTIKLWNMDTGAELSTLRGHRYVLFPIFFDF
jgi:WD40 repeat protein